MWNDCWIIRYILYCERIVNVHRGKISIDETQWNKPNEKIEKVHMESRTSPAHVLTFISLSLHTLFSLSLSFRRVRRRVFDGKWTFFLWDMSIRVYSEYTDRLHRIVAVRVEYVLSISKRRIFPCDSFLFIIFSFFTNFISIVSHTMTHVN